VKKGLKIAVIAVVVILIVAQFVRPDRTNPPVDPAATLYAATEVPADVKSILDRSCSDCHSNQTTYPWYSQVTPVNWWLADHIAEGRRELNVSEYNTYQPRKKAKKLEEICEQVKTGEMPLPSYTIIHRDAALTQSDIETLCNWTNAERARLGQ
jgi:hypothetical protein